MYRMRALAVSICLILVNITLAGDSGRTLGPCAPSNDLCADATAIGPGHHSFDPTCANTDGNPYLYECGVICEFPCMQNDVWFDLTTSCSSVVNITPDASMYGYTIIVYEGCHCPDPWDDWQAVGCNWLFGGAIQFNAEAGTCYKIRIGNAYAPGAFTLAMTPPCDVEGDGDFDFDGDVDEDDYADFPNCMTAPNGTTAAAYPSRCRPFDFDADNAIDLRDAAELLRVVQMQQGAILHVPSVYPTIQQAIDAAGDHDTVLVAPGTYVEDINFLGKPVHVLAEAFLSPVAPAATIIEGTGSKSVVTFGGTESLSSLLAGFTVTGGNAPKGGGVLGNASRARIQNCNITLNTAASEGAGIYDLDGRIDDCAIIYNVVTFGFGGGVSRCDGVIRNTFVWDNSARFGGGIYDSQAKITECRITNNVANVGGGGLANCSGLIERCVISYNVSGNSGGGLYGCDGTIRSCLISGNRAALGGGGLSRCSGLVTNCTVVGNRLTYGGVNSGHAISYCEGEILNSIFWDNFTPFGYLSVTPQFSVVPPGSPAGSGNVYSNPLFHSSGIWDPSGYWIDGDYHLSATSPARDSGDPTYLPSADEKDLDGNSRLVGPHVDIGAYEFIP